MAEHCTNNNEQVVVDDQPISMRDLYEQNFINEGLRDTQLLDAGPYRRRRTITKIFRDNKYAPSLDDIEEIDETSYENNNGTHARSSSPTLSLYLVHKERIRNSKGRTRRSSTRKFSTRNRTNLEALTAST